VAVAVAASAVPPRGFAKKASAPRPPAGVAWVPPPGPGAPRPAVAAAAPGSAVSAPPPPPPGTARDANGADTQDAANTGASGNADTATDDAVMRAPAAKDGLAAAERPAETATGAAEPAHKSMQDALAAQDKSQHEEPSGVDAIDVSTAAVAKDVPSIGASATGDVVAGVADAGVVATGAVGMTKPDDSDGDCGWPFLGEKFSENSPSSLRSFHFKASLSSQSGSDHESEGRRQRLRPDEGRRWRREHDGGGSDSSLSSPAPPSDAPDKVTAELLRRYALMFRPPPSAPTAPLPGGPCGPTSAILSTCSPSAVFSQSAISST